MKKCFKCGNEKALTEFYKHPSMPDGRVNKCKECNKADVRANRKDNVEYYRKYDRARGGRQDSEYLKAYRKDNPKKYKATTMIGNAIRDGRMKKLPCEICGKTERIHGHHDDYAYPLLVRWLCAVHHKQWHDENGEGLNG